MHTLVSPTPSSGLTGPITAMVLAAGRGERMRPSTDTTPKPLLSVRGKPLLQWHLEALLNGACNGVVVNTAWLGHQLVDKFNGVFPIQPPSNKPTLLLNKEQAPRQLGIQYSHEGLDFGAALETAGGITRAMPLLGEIFWVLAADVFAPDFVFRQEAVDQFVASNKLAHLWLVPNPEHKPRGDFGLERPVPGDFAGNANLAPGLALNLHDTDPRPRLTYSTIGLYRRALFAPPWCDIPLGNPHGIAAALAPLLRAAMDQNQISASLYNGRWTDVGTPERLAQLNQVV